MKKVLILIAVFGLTGCVQDVYTSAQSEAIVGEMEADSMQRMINNGTATDGDIKVYAARNAKRWTKVREGTGVK